MNSFPGEGGTKKEALLEAPPYTAITGLLLLLETAHHFLHRLCGDVFAAKAERQCKT
jgi:hypothetical protein